MKEWLTTDEMAEAVGFYRETLAKKFRKGKYPPDKVKRTDKGKPLFHCSLIPILKEHKATWLAYQEDALDPKDAVPYDGYLLRPDEIARLEQVRWNNGYRAAHWTTKSLTELIAMGGDNQTYASN